MFPHSLGILYTAVTQFLGFPGYGDEYKVMALASFGRPRFLPAMRKIVRLTEDGRFETDVASHYVYQADGRGPLPPLVILPGLSDSAASAALVMLHLRRRTRRSPSDRT